MTLMADSEEVREHFANPRNAGAFAADVPGVGTGLVEAAAHGDVTKLQIRVDRESGVIAEARFKTFGCGSAIACASLATEWVRGRTPEQALLIDHAELASALRLSPDKVHCALLAVDAIKAAVADHRGRQLASAEERT